MSRVSHPTELYQRYQRLQRYVHWSDADAARVAEAARLVEPFFDSLIDDFYEEIRRHPDASRVITGGSAQIERLKGTLRNWLVELFSGQYDANYVCRRWRVGLKHVEIGLAQVYANAALSRIRVGLLDALENAWQGSLKELLDARRSLNKLLDLDLAVIGDAYQCAILERHQRAERLIAVGQIAGGVAHELRNPLNVVKTSVYYLLHAKNPSPEKRLEHLQRIERQVGLADRVITTLSDFAKLPFPQLRPVTVATLVAEALESSDLTDDIQVATHIPEGLSAVMVDADQIQIALSNLVRNARDAMEGQGRLEILAGESGGVVKISVTDTGVGIPAESLARIMEPLYSTKTRGLGLGLAITRAILDKHGGQLHVTSQEGQGSTFTVSLRAEPPSDQETIT